MQKKKNVDFEIKKNKIIYSFYIEHHLIIELTSIKQQRTSKEKTDL